MKKKMVIKAIGDNYAYFKTAIWIFNIGALFNIIFDIYIDIDL